MKTLVLLKIILSGLLFFSLVVASAQSVSGRWKGYLMQEAQSFDFRFYIDIKQQGEQIKGVTLIVDYAGDSAKMRFKGTCLDGVIKIKESKVIYSSKTNGLHWCIKSIHLQYLKNDNGEFLRRDWNGNC